MIVFELLQPGQRLRGLSGEQERRDTEALIYLFATCVDEAAVSLALFEESQAQLDASVDRAAWAAQGQRETEIFRELEEQLDSALSPEAWAEAYAGLHAKAAERAKRERWEAGAIPRGYVFQAPFVHAKSCVYALSTIGKGFENLTGLPSCPAAVSTAQQTFQQGLPGLVGVRDSSAHPEDRVQGKKYERRITPGPIENSLVHAPAGGVLAVGNLNGNRYGGTNGDGSYGEVEVSARSVGVAQRCVQDVMDAFTWEGIPSHRPN